jgi:hypothetical protein
MLRWVLGVQFTRSRHRKEFKATPKPKLNAVVMFQSVLTIPICPLIPQYSRILDTRQNMLSKDLEHQRLESSRYRDLSPGMC